MLDARGAPRIVLHVLAALVSSCDETDAPVPGLDSGPTSPDAALEADAMADAGGCSDCLDAAVAADEGPARYRADRAHSPLTPSVVERLRDALGPGLAEDAFAKIGDSITVSTSFLHCFATDDVALADHDALEPTLEHFSSTTGGGSTPFTRTSAAAAVGWSASAPLQGDPTPLDLELDALDAAFAVVMFGTNDLQARDPVGFGEDMLALTDRILERGVVPLLSSVPPRDDDPVADSWVPLYGAIVRGVAQARQVPFVDLERVLRGLSGHGLGPDGIHPDAYAQDGLTHPCWLDAAALAHGYNQRNLLTLEALDRLRAVVLEGQEAPDPPEPPAGGEGTVAAPSSIDGLPWSDLASTEGAPSDALDRYDGCGATQDESGPEVIYALTLEAPTTLHALVIDGPEVDVDLHLLGGVAREDACLARHDTHLVAELEAGEYFLALDTYVPADGRARSGEYVLVLATE